MYECFHCGNKAVVWDADFDFSDYCLEGQGIVHVCHCANCGAEIEYKISIPDGEEGEDVEVVRCKECEFATEAILHDEHKLVCGKDGRGLMLVDPEFYCADGQKETEDGNGDHSQHTGRDV